MKNALTVTLVIGLLVFAGCNGTQGGNEAEPPSSPVGKVGTQETVRPQKITEMMSTRGEQDQAMPELIVESPMEGAVIESSTVKVKVRVAGDLKGMKMGKDANGMGNHVHVILDNQPYAAHYMWDEGFELRNVTDGPHTLRMFPSRPWHESYKNEKAFQIIRFTVRNGNADESKPTTDANGNTMAGAKKPEKEVEGVDVKESVAGEVDFSKPLLTYSRPKGEYKGADSEAIMIDFWLLNAKLKGDGGEHRVRYSVNGGEAEYLDKWEPVWLKGWSTGKNSVRLELVDKDGNLVENGGYNSTTREISVLPN